MELIGLLYFHEETLPKQILCSKYNDHSFARLITDLVFSTALENAFIQIKGSSIMMLFTYRTQLS